MHVFKHPKYYTELRKRNRVARNPMGGYSQSDQAISSNAPEKPAAGERSPGPGHKLQASIGKRQAPAGGKPQAASLEKQASSPEEQASSLKP